MQVIPPTGAEINAELGWPPGYETADLYRPYVSLRFGTHYLAKQRDQFDGRIDVALAAYNGGPGRAARWLESAGDDPDLFLELITLHEPRIYIQRIKEHLGLVQGSTVRTKHLGRDFMAGLKNIFGGELRGYTELLQEAREEAVNRMKQQASAVGANAVLNVRFSTSSVTQGAAELFAYGTAVILE